MLTEGGIQHASVTYKSCTGSLEQADEVQEPLSPSVKVFISTLRFAPKMQLAVESVFILQQKLILQFGPMLSPKLFPGFVSTTLLMLPLADSKKKPGPNV